MSHHDCRLNYCGTAKAMESDVAVQLVTSSSVLKEKNVEIEVFIADNDSSGFSAIKKAAKHNVGKQADRNHTVKELGRTESCYKNIPNHVFNIHDNCNSKWCRYEKDKENFEFQRIRSGFKNAVLFEELTILFNKLSGKAEMIVFNGSTQSNESLNNIINRKAPKGLSYGQSESYDYGVACAILQKNQGEKYVQNVMTNCNLSPGSYTAKHCERIEKSVKMRMNMAKTSAANLRRNELRRDRSQLKNKRECIEGQTYESNMDLMQSHAPENNDNITELESQFYCDVNSDCYALVFFDTKTGGFHMNDDVLQMGLEYKEFLFNRYIKPTKCVNPKASASNGLTNKYGDLYLRGVRIESSPLKKVIEDMLVFLKEIGKPCILVAHDANFDVQRLLTKIKSLSMIEDFDEILIGFTDTLPLFYKSFPDQKNSKNGYKLTVLVELFTDLSTKNAHDAIEDVLFLEKLVYMHLNYNDLIDNLKTVDHYLECLPNPNNPFLSKDGLSYKNMGISNELDGFIQKSFQTFNEVVNMEMDIKRVPSMVIQLEGQQQCTNPFHEHNYEW
ncbi:hypothetical protein TKK_0017028 [Trichogramma kaykai]